MTANEKYYLGGQAFLALVFMMGVIMIGIGITIVLFGNSFVDTGYGYRAAQSADAVAASGAQDALLQLSRNSSFATTCGCGVTGYNLAVGSSTAVVTVNATTSVSGGVIIVSTATVSNRTRKINVTATVNGTTNQVTVISWKATQ